MSYSRLQLYNDALLMCGERGLGDVTGVGTGLNADEEQRHLLDQVWNNNGVDGCLEEAQWEFAMRTIRIDYDPGIQPDFGYAHAFDKPDDWVLTSAVCSDEFFRAPLMRYTDETGFWYADEEIIYVRIVSNDASYGGDLSLWPRSFQEFAAAHFASKIILKTSNDEDRVKLFINPQNPERSIRGRALLNAKSRCAMAGPTQMKALGQWSISRIRGSGRRDGGDMSGNLY